MNNQIIGNMTNLGDSGQDEFVQNWAKLAEVTLYEMGVSHTFIESDASSYILAKMVTDYIEDGGLSSTTLELIKTLRTNHTHSEDNDV